MGNKAMTSDIVLDRAFFDQLIDALRYESVEGATAEGESADLAAARGIIQAGVLR
jgi:hypothetical protein